MTDTTIAAANDRAPAHAPTPDQLARWRAEADEMVRHLGQLPRGGCDPERWRVLLGDVDRFVSSGMLDRAKDLGWTQKDLFGLDVLEPWSALDRQGLVVALRGRSVVGLTGTGALLGTQSGATDSFVRCVPGPQQVLDPSPLTVLDQLAC